ncbi:hypothetical protein [Demequina sp. NBRC 110054]|nr:hypothetical protein [Demequina sp. NBRC 110054]
MFESITAAFIGRSKSADYSHLPASVRDEVIDAMSATSVYDIR